MTVSCPTEPVLMLLAWFDHWACVFHPISICVKLTMPPADVSSPKRFHWLTPAPTRPKEPKDTLTRLVLQDERE